MPTTSKNQLSQFLGLVSYYWNMWEMISHTLSTLTKITPNNVTFNGLKLNKKHSTRLSGL